MRCRVSLFKGSDVIDNMPDILLIGYLFLKFRHIAFSFSYSE